jgi:hypothetical protein
MGNYRKFGALTSSVNPNELSLTISSISQVLIGIGAWFAVSKGLDPAAAQTNLQAIFDVAAQIIPMVYTLYHSMQTAWGLLRKAYVFFFGDR